MAGNPGAMFLLISTHTSLAGRDFILSYFPVHDKISTHTSLAGRDQIAKAREHLVVNFYSHVPRGT